MEYSTKLSLKDWNGKDGCNETNVHWESCLNYGPIILKKVLM